jgi:hypothetical protein
MKMPRQFALLACLALAAFNPLAAQEIKIPTDTSQLVSIETKDDNTFIGYIRQIEMDHILVQTDKFGQIKIQKKDIRALRSVEQNQIVEGEFWSTDANSTRYLFGPNGYGLRKGEGYYQNTWIFFNQVSYGITDNFTLGVGVIPLFIFAGEASPVWITPKLTIPIKKDQINLGVGGLFATVIGDEAGSFGVAYGQITFGSRDRNINLGLGYGYAGDSWANTPTISISGIYRTGRKFALLSENYLFDTGDNNFVLSSIGGRFIGKHVSIDAALVIPTVGTDGEFFAIPWLGLTVPFGRAVD